MQENYWLADRGYGAGCALGFVGDEAFRRKSENFARNYLIGPTAKIEVLFGNISVVNTSLEQLRVALYDEAYDQAMKAYLRVAPRIEYDDADYPEDYFEKLEEYSKALLRHNYDSSVIVPRDPSEDFPLVEETDEMHKNADIYATAKAEEQIYFLRYGAFMPRYFNNKNDLENLNDLCGSEEEKIG